MAYSSSPAEEQPQPPAAAHLSPSIVYYLRKLLRQNLDRLTSVVAEGAAISVDPLSNLNAVLESLYTDEGQMRSAIEKIDRLTLFHQSLSGSQHRQQIHETEEQIFWILGFKLQEETAADRGTLLIIDDVATEIILLTVSLKKQKYRVLSALDGQSALKLALEESPDLILLDIKIPGMDGYAICNQLKRNANTANIPVIFISSISDAQGKVKAFQVGGVDFIGKPFQVEEVIARIENQLNLRKLQNRLEEQNVRLQSEIKDRQVLEERYRGLFESSLDGIFQTTTSGAYLRVNPALARIYGYTSPDELMNAVTNIGEQLYLQPGRREGIKTYLQQHGEVFGAESRVRRKDGSKIWISENIRVVLDSCGNPEYYEGTVRDITEQRKLQSVLHHQRKHTERLLQCVLPKSIADRLKYAQQTIADSYDEVSVLFADIDNFTAFSSRISPTEQVKLLNQLFSDFDQIAEQLGLEKIKTIRDVYFVAGGVPDAKPDHAEAIAEMALGMQEAADRFQKHLGEPFQIRVGISSGSVVAGVLGSKKFTYDLWGDPVNLASRMQSNGLPGKIQVTPATYRRLKDQYHFEERGITNVYGMGEMMTYWLQGKKDHP
jgi:adenylate cyclase